MLQLVIDYPNAWTLALVANVRVVLLPLVQPVVIAQFVLPSVSDTVVLTLCDFFAINVISVTAFLPIVICNFAVLKVQNEIDRPVRGWPK